jgi:hypothetical protein
MGKNKMSESVVVVKNNENGQEYSVKAEQKPRDKEAGVIFTLKINQIGIAHLQAKGIDVKTTTALKEFFSKNTGMPMEGYGTLDTGKFSTYVDGKAFGNNVAVPQVVKTAPVEPNKAVPETNKDETNIKIILDALAKGTPQEKIQAGLNKTFGDAKGLELWNKATAPAVASPVVAPDDFVWAA